MLFGCRLQPTGSSRANPRLLARADGMRYWTVDGREVLDAVSGLWCVNAGHGRREITDAVTQQLNTMEFAPTFQMGHPIAFELANRLAAIAPPGMDRVFFHEFRVGVRRQPALKSPLPIIALAAPASARASSAARRAITEWASAACRWAAMVHNRKIFGSSMVPGVDHLPTPWISGTTPFREGCRTGGAHLANELERLIALQPTHPPSPP